MGNVNARDAGCRQPPTGNDEDEDGMSLAKISAQVTRVHVDGVDRTKEDILLRKIQPIFKATHFEELVLTAQDARNHLQGTSTFSFP